MARRLIWHKGKVPTYGFNAKKVFNPLKPCSYSMYRRISHEISSFANKNNSYTKQGSRLYTLVSLREAHCVSFEVGTGFLFVMYIKFSLQTITTECG